MMRPKSNASFDEDKNPLLRHLPTLPESDAALARYLTRRPVFAGNQRSLPKRKRLLLLDTLDQTYCPLPECIQFCRRFERLLLSSYRYRADLATPGQKGLYADRGAYSPHTVASYLSSGSCLLVAGVSGAGKSTLAKLVRLFFGGVINHTTLSGGKIDLLQIPVLYVRCPETSGKRSFCIAFLDALEDTFLDYGYKSPINPSRTSMTLDKLKSTVKQLCKTYAIGVIILDEFQDMLEHARSRNRVKGDRLTTNFLLWLRDTVRVPIVYIGTFAMLDLFKHDPRSARRSARGGALLIDRIRSADDPFWKPMCQAYWDLQWVRKPRPMKDLHKTLFSLTQGVPDHLHLLMKCAQELAIESEQEYIDKLLLEEAFDTCIELHEAIAALKEGSSTTLALYPDLWHPWAEARYRGRKRSGDYKQSKAA